jgi:prophage antirepressor-like protein
MDEGNALVVFQGTKIRRTRHNNEWWFSLLDIVTALTDSKDAKQYIKKMRQRDEPLNSNWGTICTPLELVALDGKKRNVTCANTAGALSKESIINIIYTYVIGGVLWLMFVFRFRKT